MSNIIILSLPMDGHFNPFVPIMNILLEKGYKIKCITGKRYKEKTEEIGASFVPIPENRDPEDIGFYNLFPELKKLRGVPQLKFYIKHILLDQSLHVLKVLENTLKEFHADVVLFDSFSAAAAWNNALGGPPCICLSILPFNIPDNNLAPYGFGMLPANNAFKRIRNKLLNFIFKKIVFIDVKYYTDKIHKSIGLPPLKEDFFTAMWKMPNLILHTSVPKFEYPSNKYPNTFKFVGPIKLLPQINYQKPKWWSELEKKRPVILINQGTVAKDLKNLVIPAIEALKDENLTLIAVPVKNGEIKNLPSNIIIESFVPFGNLFPHVDLMITNGGFGATQNALAHGIPIIVSGATEDKMEVAARVEYSGAGINLKRGKPSPQKIKEAVIKVLTDPIYKNNAVRLKKEFARYNAPMLATKYIEGLIQEK